MQTTTDFAVAPREQFKAASREFVPVPDGRSDGRNLQDLYVYLLIIALGVMQFMMTCRASDFVGDAYYFELAKSLLAGKGYGFNSKPQTMLPPGFAVLLAVLIRALGTNYATLVRAMPVFTTLGFLTTYEVLRSKVSRGVAGSICLLLGSAPGLFLFATKIVFSDMPYFFLSMLLIYSMTRLDSKSGWSPERISLWLFCGVLTFATVILRSTGIAMLSGIMGWLAVSFLRERDRFWNRALIFIPLVLVGMATQAGWMHYAAQHQFTEWPVHGYQEHYAAQLKLKLGNDPEQGMATIGDVLLRPINTADDNAAALVALLTRKMQSPAWYSPTVLIPLLLIIIGLGSSFWPSGGDLLDWYFLSYEGMYLFWPWNFELRFLFPVVPLACLYLWRGMVTLWQLATDKPRQTGSAFIILATVGIAGSNLWGWGIAHPRVVWCIGIWAFIGAVSIWVAVGGRDRIRKVSTAMEKAMSIGGSSLPRWQFLAASIVTILFAVGVYQQFVIGMTNVNFNLENDISYSDIEAAQWVKAHSDPSTVVMARKEDLVYHYSQRRIVWFPPTGNAQLLMDGIRKYHVQLVVVVDDNLTDSYWKPPTQISFQILAKAYPDTFRLVHAMPHEKIYAVS
jgi:hypothetical protein